MNEPRIGWQAPEFEAKAKSASWYWGSIGVALLVLTFAVWENNFLFGFFVIAAEVMVLVWGSRAPQAASFALTPKGLEIEGQARYAYAELKNFSIGEWNGAYAELQFRTKKTLGPSVKIFVPRAELQKVEKLLTALLPRVPHEDSFVESLEKFFRF